MNEVSWKALYGFLLANTLPEPSVGISFKADSKQLSTGN